MDEEETRARARAQYFGPEMLEVIGRTVARLEEEIAEARAIEPDALRQLLGSILAPLREIRERATGTGDVAGD
jgi:hypothetical protein